MTKISLVRTADRTAGTRQAIELLEINPVRGKSVVLKPNFNSPEPSPVTTHNDTLRSLVATLKEMGAGKITLAERCGAIDTMHDILEQKGIFTMAKELGFEILDLQTAPLDDWVLVKPPDSHWKNGFLFAKIYREAESIVSTCCLKTHKFGAHFSLSLKCSVGMVKPGLRSEGFPYMDELHSSPYHRHMIAEINTAYSPDLIVLDGVEAFVSGGPHIGTIKNANVMLGGTDRIAIDAVGVAILRQLGTTPNVSRGKIFEQEQIKRAAELGLGVKSAAEIEIVTGDKDSAKYAEEIKEILSKG